MIWRWSKPSPPPTRLLDESRESRDEFAAAVAQLGNYVEELREVTAELQRVAKEHARKDGDVAR